MAETRAPDHPEIREAVARLCAGFPGEYWRALDRDMRYPTEFVQALTEAGYLAVLIPEEYGGSGLGLSAGRDHGRDPARRLQWRRVPCADVRHGDGAAARFGGPEAALSPEGRDRRAASAGLRRHRADV